MLSNCLNIITVLFLSNIAFAQVGINTTDPKGILDLNSTTLGVVYPTVALTATDDPSPVVNPQGGAIVAGTVVYNTATTTTGLVTDVKPGIYVWDDDPVNPKWIVHYKKRQSELFNQTSVLRTEADFAGGWQDVPGLEPGTNTFIAKYTGLYRIEVKANFAGGKTETNGSIFVSQNRGLFRFLLNGTPYNFETTAFSAYSSYIGGGTHFEGIWKESSETNYVTLTAGQTYNFSLSFDAYDAPGFVGNGSTYTPQSSVDLINEDFEDVAGVPYTVVQNFTPDPQCPTQGWVATTTSPCGGCSGKTLNIQAGNTSNCQQDATARIAFTPTVNRVDISFDYSFDQQNGGPDIDSFRAYLWDEVLGVKVGGVDLVYLLDVDELPGTSYNGSIPVVATNAHSLRFEYYNARKGLYASVDNVVISELSGATGTPVDDGHGYVGNEIDCQIEFTYIGE